MSSLNNCQPNKRRVKTTNASQNLQILQKVLASKCRKNQGSVLLRKTWQSSVIDWPVRQVLHVQLQPRDNPAASCLVEVTKRPRWDALGATEGDSGSGNRLEQGNEEQKGKCLGN